MSILQERLSQAIASKKNDINSFIWKGEKREVDGKFVQDEKRLVDCTLEELQRNYDYCKQMLYNENKQKPGRYVLISIIDDQIQRCNCELFLRWLKTENNKDRFSFVSEIKRVLDTADKNILENLNQIPIKAMVSDLPDEYSSLPVNLILDGGLDKLGKFNKQHITLTFILKQGVWFTPEEMKDLTIKDEETGEVRDRLEVVKENLALGNNIPLKVTPKGLTYSQLRAMTTLKSKKYSELTTEQLKTLRNRILFALRDNCKFHIKQWETRMKQLEMVAESKGFMLEP